MRIRITVVSVVVLALTATGIAVADGPSAGGFGTALKEDVKGNNKKGDLDGKTADFYFSTELEQPQVRVVAVNNDDGTLNQKFSGNVDCLSVVANTAYISGEVPPEGLELGTNTNDGKYFLLKAVDRGDGNDRFDWLRKKRPYDCNNVDLKRDYPVVRGDVVVTG